MAMTILLRGVFLILLVNIGGVLSDPQTKLLKQDCSGFKIAVEISDFLSNFNRTFGDIRKQLSNDSNIHFGTFILMCTGWSSAEIILLVQIVLPASMLPGLKSDGIVLLLMAVMSYTKAASSGLQSLS